MSSMLRSACKTCQLLRVRYRNAPGWQNNFHGRQLFVRSISNSSCLNQKPLSKNVKDEVGVFDSVVQERTNWSNIEHDIVDTETFQMIKHQYEDRMKELEDENSIKIKVEDTKPITRRSQTVKRKSVPMSKYDGGHQLTYVSEQSVLAELDIYIYLGQIHQAGNLFNYHRRHGHMFNIDTYNKMIHAWAVERNWRNIQLLLTTLKHEGLEPNYQTYAGLFEVCGHLGDVKKTENVIMMLQNQGLDIHQVLKESKLSKQQVERVLHALKKVYPDYEDKSIKTSSASASYENNPESSVQFLQNENITKLIQHQIECELQGSMMVPSIDKTKMRSSLALKRSGLYQEITEQWRQDFIKEIIHIRKAKSKKAFIYNRCVAFSSVLLPEELADIVFKEVVPLICGQTQGTPVNFLTRLLGQMIYVKFCSKYKYEKGVSETVQQIAQQYCATVDQENNITVPRKKWMKISDELPFLASEDIIPNPWPTKIKAMAASVVLDVLKKVSTIDTSLFLKSKRGAIEQSLSHHYEYMGVQKYGILKFHPTMSRLYSSYLAQRGDISFQSNKLPTLLPPRPWVSATSGAYFLLHSDLVRTVTGNYKLQKLSNAAGNGSMDQILDSLNYLGNCSWKVNERILDLMIDMFNGDGNMKLDIIGPKLPYIEQRKSKKAMTPEERKSRQRKKKLYHEMFALRMDQLYRLSISNYFRGKKFWIPNNMDFRGRVYPIAPHCSHIGNDVARGLLLFSDGKKLGKNGLRWLKVHLVNVHGQLKKSSLQERVDYVDERLYDIFDSADNPTTGRKWWQDGSDPWQTLVACMELTDAIRSGDPENFVSYLPVHQDGSCNGLQHYAALGRDDYGARQVNLVPAEKPQDVYLEVANLVEKARIRDSEKGVEIANLLEGKISRKVVKQTVMTVVYGVTFVGGRLQIEKQLKEIDIGNDVIFKASVYVVQEVFKSLTEMFTSARQIQDWLTISAAQIALTGNCVDWITPLGLPVVQPYHRSASENILTPLQSVVSTNNFDYTQTPHLTKQKGGFPPNFVHSLDSTHLMLTALRCQDDKMTFASVHDSFWTHACDIDRLNVFCREEFVTLHKLPILADLKKHFDETYAGLPLRKSLKDGTTNANFGNLPEQGTFDITRVLDSVYFFS